MIKTGCFDGLGQERSTLMVNMDGAVAYASQKKENESTGQGSLFEGSGIKEFSDFVFEKIEEFPKKEKLRLEKELMGFLCALGIGGAALILALLPSGLGMGDVKLCALIGLWLGPLGWDVALSGSLAGVILAGMSALVLMAARVVGLSFVILYDDPSLHEAFGFLYAPH